MRYVVVPLVDAELDVLTDQPATTMRMNCGAAYFREAGVRHELVARTSVDFVEIEIRPAPHDPLLGQGHRP